MTKEQKLILEESSNICYFPYEFQDAIDNHIHDKSIKDELKNIKTLSEMGKFWQFIENKKCLWNQKEYEIELNQESSNEIGTLVFIGYGVESIDIYKENKSENLPLVRSIFKGLMVGIIPIHYDVSSMKLKLNFRYNLAGPYDVNIKFNQYREPEIDYQALYISNMKVSHSLGQDLINVYFQLADSKVDKTEVILFKTLNNNETIMIAKFHVENGVYYHSITGLAYGDYEFNVVQYVNNNILVESPKTKFKLVQPNYSGKPILTGR